MLVDTDKEKIRAEAREILDKFGNSLGKIDVKDVKKETEGKGVRAEKEGDTCDVEFRTIMFKNASHADEECLIAEKGAWEK